MDRPLTGEDPITLEEAKKKLEEVRRKAQSEELYRKMEIAIVLLQEPEEGEDMFKELDDMDQELRGLFPS